jgi:hypothetical protein
MTIALDPDHLRINRQEQKHGSPTNAIIAPGTANDQLHLNFSIAAAESQICSPQTCETRKDTGLDLVENDSTITGQRKMLGGAAGGTWTPAAV